MRWIHDLLGLHDFIALVVVGAPSDFPIEDYRAPDDQLNLDRAFEELRNGLEFVAISASNPTFHDRLRAVLDESLAAYRAGERRKGAHLLQDFRDMIFGSNDRVSRDAPGLILSSARNLFDLRNHLQVKEGLIIYATSCPRKRASIENSNLESRLTGLRLLKSISRE